MFQKSCFVILFCLSSSLASAEEYRDPNEMDQEEYQQARQISSQHEECMNEYAQAQLQQQTDPRVIADHAMKNCANILEKLHQTIVSWNYPPEFGSYYVSGISNRNANKLLSNLMRYMAMPR